MAAAQHHSAPKCVGRREARSPHGGQTTARGSGRCAALLSRPRRSTCRRGLPALTGSRRSGRRSGYSDTLWSRSSPHRCSMFLCRRWRNSCCWDVLRPHDRQVPELVIEVPKIICEDIPTRSSVPEPQLVEQLVDVPTVLSVAVLQQRTAAAREEEEMEELLDVPAKAPYDGATGPTLGAHWRLFPGEEEERGGRGNFLATLPVPRLAARHHGRYGPEGHLCRDTVPAFVARAARTWKPGLSTSHWYLAPTCSVPARLMSTGILKFLGDDFWKMFHHCLAVDTRSCVGLRSFPDSTHFLREGGLPFMRAFCTLLFALGNRTLFLGPVFLAPCIW